MYHSVIFTYFMICNHVKKWAYVRLWPAYDCEQCVGQEYWQGCYCAYYGGWSPAGPRATPWWVEPGRRLYTKIWGDPNA